MADTVNRKTRSRIMRAVKSRDNVSTERRFKAALVRNKIRGWRLHDHRIVGHPDFVFPRKKLAVFLDGCFWHGCPVCYRRPHSNKTYWDAKVARNKARDQKTSECLMLTGWRVIRFWEHQVNSRQLRECVEKIRMALKSRPRAYAFEQPIAAEHPGPYGVNSDGDRSELAPKSPGLHLTKTFADFFAGIGLMRMGLEQQGWNILFANDIDPQKYEMYKAHFRDTRDHYALGDIHKLSASDVPDVTLATASFPCNDLSLAGPRSGLHGKQSSAFWGFTRLLGILGSRKPPLVLLENVTGFLTSHAGKDFQEALIALNRLGYSVDPFIIDAVHFVPQSRPRLFVLATLAEPLPHYEGKDGLLFYESECRPKALANFIFQHPEIRWNIRKLPTLPDRKTTINDILEDIPQTAREWWSHERASYLLNQMSPRHRQIADKMIGSSQWSYGTVFRRIRNAKSMAELRTDGLAGCLRTPRGGSGRQILFKAGKGKYFARLLTPRECARLMGANKYMVNLPLNQALFGFGDAVCVPVIEWIAKYCLNRLCEELSIRVKSLVDDRTVASR